MFVSFATGPTSTEMHPTTLDTMAASIAQSLGVANPTTQQVFIRADQHVRYGIFMGVVNRLQIDGYYKIGLITEEVQSYASALLPREAGQVLSALGRRAGSGSRPAAAPRRGCGR